LLKASAIKLLQPPINFTVASKNKLGIVAQNAVAFPIKSLTLKNNIIMIIRKFKLGDWVKIKGDGNAPKMEIVKYVPKKDPLTGTINNNTFVECVYYSNGERYSRTIHQNRLLKLLESGGIYQS
jgi:hypothetical protein